MGTVYDRRRVNGPDETYQPIYNLSVSGPEEAKTLWNLNEYSLLQDPAAIPAQSLTLHTQVMGTDGLSVARIAKKQMEPRTDGRGLHESRPICTSLNTNPRYSTWHHPKC